jgi:hypothetical protein
MPATKWFYKIEPLVVREPMTGSALHDITVKLDALGEQAWEAVSVVTSGTQAGHTFVLLKRPRNWDRA